MESLKYRIINEKEVEVIWNDNYSEVTELSINSKAIIEGKEYKVTSIGNLAFFGLSNLVTIKIPSSVSRVGDRAFYGCKNLSVTYNKPKSTVILGDESFMGTKKVSFRKSRVANI